MQNYMWLTVIHLKIFTFKNPKKFDNLYTVQYVYKKRRKKHMQQRKVLGWKPIFPDN